MTHAKPHDFPEDAVYENGSYFNRCCGCGITFTGLKNRLYCKACHGSPEQPSPVEPTVSR